MDPLEVVRTATAQRLALELAAQGQIRYANKQWQAAIREALGAGVLPREVAAAAGVTRQRVVQIGQSLSGE